jgi:purine-binding chemotaxis protein CheW
MTTTEEELAPAEEKQAPMFLTFTLSDHIYGIPLGRVLEIIGMLPITPIPETAPYIRGVINLRGRVIPVVDARARFGMPSVDYDPRTCVIVVETGGWSVGLVVDRVEDVTAIPAEQTEPPPAMSVAGDHYLSALGKVGDGVRRLLDVDRFLATT